MCKYQREYAALASWVLVELGTSQCLYSRDGRIMDFIVVARVSHLQGLELTLSTVDHK